MNRTRTERPSWGALLASVSLLLGLVLAAVPARADGDAARAEARQHFNRGVTLAKQRSYAEALSEFQRAYAAVPHFSVLYNIGQAQIALGQSAEAVATLQRYLDEGGAALDAKRRAEVEQALAREREKTPSAVAPSTAGAPSDATPLGGVILPPVASPSAAATPAPAAPPPVAPAARSEVHEVAPGSDEPVDFAIAEPQAPPPRPRAAPRSSKLGPAHFERRPANEASPASQRTLAYVVGAAGLALTGGALAHYAWNRGRYRDWQSKYATYFRDPTESNRREANALSDSIDRASAVTVALAVGAGVALGTSSLLWITSSPASSDSHARGFQPFFNLKGTF